jgi:hypothetical protein
MCGQQAINRTMPTTATTATTTLCVVAVVSGLCVNCCCYGVGEVIAALAQVDNNLKILCKCNTVRVANIIKQIGCELSFACFATCPAPAPNRQLAKQSSKHAQQYNLTLTCPRGGGLRTNYARYEGLTHTGWGCVHMPWVRNLAQLLKTSITHHVCYTYVLANKLLRT